MVEANWDSPAAHSMIACTRAHDGRAPPASCRDSRRLSLLFPVLASSACSNSAICQPQPTHPTNPLARPQFEDPNGALVFERHGASEADFHFTAAIEGEYKLCFTAKGERGAGRGPGWRSSRGGVGRAEGSGTRARCECTTVTACCSSMLRAWALRSRRAGWAFLWRAGTSGRGSFKQPRWRVHTSVGRAEASASPTLLPCPADYHTAQSTRIRMRWTTGADAQNWEAVAKKDNLNVIQVGGPWAGLLLLPCGGVRQGASCRECRPAAAFAANSQACHPGFCDAPLLPLAEHPSEPACASRVLYCASAEAKLASAQAFTAPASSSCNAVNPEPCPPPPPPACRPSCGGWSTWCRPSTLSCRTSGERRRRCAM